MTLDAAAISDLEDGATAELPTASPLPPPQARAHWRAMLTMADQGLVSLASFATNFLLLHHFAHEKEHYAYYTLAFNLLIWVAEFHGTLVFTPHTILSPRRAGLALRRLHGSTLLHHFGVSLLAMAALGVAAALVFPHDHEMGRVLAALSGGTIAIGLRNYARPYSFTARQPIAAVLMDAAVCGLQIGGVLLLAHYGTLTATSAIIAIAVAAALPSAIWLLLNRRGFAVSLPNALRDLKIEWPHTRWVLFSGLVWNAGMQLYPWLIAVLVGKLEVAIWGACYQLAAVANPLMMGLQNFIGPRVAEAYTERDRAAFRRFVFKVAFATAALMVGPAIVLSIFASTALRWISRGEYTGHQLAITLLCFAIVLQAITFTLSRGLFALQRADLDMACNFGPLLLLFSGGAWLTLHYGTTGAAGSMLIAQIISSGSRSIVFARATPSETLPRAILDQEALLRGAA